MSLTTVRNRKSPSIVLGQMGMDYLFIVAQYLFPQDALEPYCSSLRHYIKPTALQIEQIRLREMLTVSICGLNHLQLTISHAIWMKCIENEGGWTVGEWANCSWVYTYWHSLWIYSLTEQILHYDLKELLIQVMQNEADFLNKLSLIFTCGLHSLTCPLGWDTG